MTKIFISYSRKDKAFAEQLNAALKEIGLDSWIDWIDIPPTADWWEQIQKGIETADAFLFLLSPDSVISKVCGREVDHAVQNGKRLIPLVVRDVNSHDVHSALTKLNWIFFRESDDFESSLKKLETGIKTNLLWVESHRRLQVRAIEWERRGDRSLLLRGKDLSEAEEQLANAGQKDPQPTDLQRQYVLESRRREIRTRNTILIIGGGILAILVFLSVFAFNQSSLANENALTAVSNQQIAQTAQMDAVDQKETAISNEQEAIRQSQIALARQLAAQAQSLAILEPDQQMVWGLLAVESMKLLPSFEASQILQNIKFSHHIRSYDYKVASLGFSPDGKYLAGKGNKEATAYIWDVNTGKEIARIIHEGSISSANPTFSPDGRFVMSVGCEALASNGNCAKGDVVIWDLEGQKIKIQMMYPNGISSSAFSPDSQSVASGGCEEIDSDGACIKGFVSVWEVATGKELRGMYTSSYITSVSFDTAFGSNSTYLITGSENGTAQTWDRKTGREINSITFDSRIDSVAFCADGKRAMARSQDRAFHIWEVFAGSEIAVIPFSSSPTDAAAFSPDCAYVVVGSSIEGTSKVWDTNSGNEVAQLSANSVFTVFITFSPGGKYLAVAEDKSIHIWQTRTWKEVGQIIHEDYLAPYTPFGFSPDERYIASGGFTSTENSPLPVELWEIILGNQVARFKKDEYRLSSVNTNGLYVLLNGPNNSTKVREIATGEEILYIRHNDTVNSVDFSPNSKYVASGGNDGTARVWDTATGREISRINHADFVWNVAFSINGQFVVSKSKDNNIQVWEAVTGKVLYNEIIQKDLLSPDARWLATVLPDNTLQLLDLQNNPLVLHRLENKLSFVAFSRDARWLALTGSDSTLQILDLQHPETKPLVLHRYENEIVAVFFSPYGNILETISKQYASDLWHISPDGEIFRANLHGLASYIYFCSDGNHVVLGNDEKTLFSIQEFPRGIEVARVTLEKNVFQGVSPDCKHILITGGDQGNILRVWDVSKNAEIAQMTHENTVTSFAFSLDGEYVVSSGGCDSASAMPESICPKGTLRIWEIYTGKEVARLPIDDAIYGLGLGPDGKYIIARVGRTGFGGGMLGIWIWRPEDQIKNTCARLPRNLTRAEWQQYIGDALPYQAICENLPIEAETTPTLAP